MRITASVSIATMTACPYWDDRYYRCNEGASTTDCIECAYDCSYRQDAIDSCHYDHTARECRDCRHVCDHQGNEDACYEDSDDGLECVGCSATDCGYYKEEREETESDDTKEEATDELTLILQEEQ